MQLGHPPQPPRYTAASVIDTASKYKLLWKLPLEDVDIVKGLSLPAGVSHVTPKTTWLAVPGRVGLTLCPHAGASQATNRESIQKSISRLDEDLNTLGQVSKLSETLSFPHQVWGWQPWSCPLVGYFPNGTTQDVLGERGEPEKGWWP